GGGTGIGRATALLLSERGADVAIAGRRSEPLEKTAEEIRAKDRRALTVSPDVRDVEQARALIERVAAELGRIDILVNNAGGAHGHVPLAKMDPAKWDRDVQLNLSAAMYCSQAALPHLKASKGNIVNISSLAGVHGTKGVAAYSAAKAGVQMLTRVAAGEWGPHVRVNCVAPGMTATEAAREGWETRGFDAIAACQVFPLKRYAECEEVAQMIVFFASPAASYITGETVAVGGGPQIGGMISTDD
ncbi:MAG: SDR family oxidoreductase, partial [Novosphingobium sp.]|nr:SDR family oxidoreductase [Novosphingobium sp.]